jgi:hypothetical protein
MKKPNILKETHILLLTDGDVENASDIVELIKKNANQRIRVHTFGFGHDAS